MAQAPAFRGHYLGIGHASRVHRGETPYWEQAKYLGVEHGEILRSLERGVRPQTDVATVVLRKLVKAGVLDMAKLDRDLEATEANELADLPAEARILLRDMFLISIRRYKASGKISRVRAESSPVGRAAKTGTLASRKKASSTIAVASRGSSVGRALAIPTGWFPAFEFADAVAA